MARFFGDPHTSEDWKSQLGNCRQQLARVNDVNPTGSNKAALDIIENLQAECDRVLHPTTGPNLS